MSKPLTFNGRFNVTSVTFSSGVWPNRQYILGGSFFDNLAQFSLSNAEAGDLFYDVNRKKYIVIALSGLNLIVQEEPYNPGAFPGSIPTSGSGALFRPSKLGFKLWTRVESGISESLKEYLTHQMVLDVDEEIGYTGLNFKGINILGSTSAEAPFEGQTGGIFDRPVPQEGDEWIDPGIGDRWIYQNGMWQFVIAGVAGPIGPTGPLGGPPGPIGPTGPSGGPQGYQGDTGIQGDQGDQGIIGNQGETGFQGFQGETGPQGDQGAQGFQGMTGDQGIMGFQGVTGEQGIPGNTGPIPTSAELGFSDIYLNARDAVVSVFIDEGGGGAGPFFVGSGFFIGPTGIIATAGHNALSGNREAHVGNLYVSVSNVNGVAGTHRVYPCDIVGVDGSADVAVLFAKSGGSFPSPALTSQPFLTWEDSRNLNPGDLAFVIGDPLGLDVQSISQGVIRDPKFTSPYAALPIEAMMIDNSGFGGNSGSPIVSSTGKAIGIYTFVYVQADSGGDTKGTETFGGGPASHIVEQIVNGILSADVGVTGAVQQVTVAPFYYYFNKGFVGITEWHAVQHSDVVFNFGVTSTQPNLQGIIVDAILAGSPIASSPIGLGYWVISADNIPLGSMDDQYALGSITWLKRPGDTVSLKYRIPPSVTIHTFVLTLAQYPVASDIIFSGNTKYNTSNNRGKFISLQPVEISKITYN